MKPFDLEMNTAALKTMFLVAPDAVFAEGRSAFQRIGYQVRQAFLQQAPRNLKQVARRGVFYAVYPKRNKAKGPRLAGRAGAFRGPANNIEDIKLLYRTTGKVAYGHEVGGTFTSPRLMPIPIGKARTRAGRTVRRYRKRRGKSGLQLSGDKVVIRRSKKRNLIAFRRVKRGKRSRLEPVAVLKRSVTLRASLGLMKTWRQSEFIRRRNLDIAQRNVMQTMRKEFRNALAG